MQCLTLSRDSFFYALAPATVYQANSSFQWDLPCLLRQMSLCEAPEGSGNARSGALDGNAAYLWGGRRSNGGTGVCTTTRKDFRMWTQVNRSQKFCQKSPWTTDIKFGGPPVPNCVWTTKKLLPLKQTTMGPWLMAGIWDQNEQNKFSEHGRKKPQHSQSSINSLETDWKPMWIKIHCKKSFDPNPVKSRVAATKTKQLP